ncbi:MAG: 2-hydroxyglutaryl-CoA dehydratase [Deltaproteobacteria bacterium]|nr:2-hydroxyglutaryl-CoA dehydratase [Deltaproteobacteria bacterium]MBT4267874.1 2-hydroxyglutaryl-CoA dehydratase [Deltaproteobacteria bacterium]MBT4638547.1 2-hydroxyglutaryl-CoA dehydratase [Deltaproteobacteria bacterium]MBT7153615.1 2-hydroxyglutaryl-CoA dehydratase [Deltaproteobacteria bacterium]MBT7715038.1 2-hydroxyglutaryl-CoA dehydratase [Deltaproteobacteria bacterium]
MIVAGCDVGTMTTKAVIVKKNSILAYDVVRTNAKPEEAAKQALDNALKKARLSARKIKYSVCTGWGRKKVTFVNKASPEVPCFVRGVRWFLPTVRSIIDVGAQTSNIVVLNEQGKVRDSIANDRCAAGTGKFIEIMAEALELDINEVGPESLRAKKNISISNQCVVFAESEMVSHVNKGEEVADIAGSIHQSIVNRLVSMGNRAGLIEDICITGGVAKNSGIVKRLADSLNVKILQIPEDSQIVSALGAAVIAMENRK